ncbi:MAG: leucine-rich repeat protein [Spirochaetes bacterium]|nr:leucine-rich repeat protein [Spirochaetota bacterium]
MIKNIFEVDKYPDGKTFLYINSDRIDDCLDYYKNGDFYGIGINSMRGFALDNLNFLKRIPEIKGLSIEADISDLGGLNHLINLKYLLINRISSELKETVFNKLEELRISEWIDKYNEFKLFSKCNNLESLYIYSYKPKEPDLYEFSNLKKLKSLEIVRCPVITMKGIDSLKTLKELTIRYFTKLEEITDITKLKYLESLEIDHCRKIKDIDIISELRGLSLLGINSCGTIESLKFLKKIKTLKRMAFLETEIMDGDFSFFLDMPLFEYAGYLNKKHYSIKSDDLNSSLNKKKGHKKL